MTETTTDTSGGVPQDCGAEGSGHAPRVRVPDVHEAIGAEGSGNRTRFELSGEGRNDGAGVRSLQEPEGRSRSL